MPHLYINATTSFLYVKALKELAYEILLSTLSDSALCPPGLLHQTPAVASLFRSLVSRRTTAACAGELCLVLFGMLDAVRVAANLELHCCSVAFAKQHYFPRNFTFLPAFHFSPPPLLPCSLFSSLFGSPAVPACFLYCIVLRSEEHTSELQSLV